MTDQPPPAVTTAGPSAVTPLPDEARILAEEAFAKVYNDPVTLAACLRAGLEAAAPALRAQGAAAERERIRQLLVDYAETVAADKGGSSEAFNAVADFADLLDGGTDGQ